MTENNNSKQVILDEMEVRSPESMHPILEAAFKYQKQIIIVVALIICSAAAYAGFNAYNTKALVKAQANLGAILTETTGQTRLDKLEDLLAIVPSSVKPAVQLELAQESMGLGKYDKAMEYWSLLENDTDNDMQIIARLGKTKSMLLGGKAADAAKELKEIAGIVPEAFAVPVYRQLALAAEAAGDKAEALRAYRELNEKPVNDKPFIEYKISQLEAK